MKRSYYRRFVFTASGGIVFFQFLYMALGVVSWSEFEGIRIFLVLCLPPILVFGYGNARLLQFHPVLRKEYRDWLLASPYHPALELPLGSPLPLLPDLIPILLGSLVLALHTDYVPLPDRIMGTGIHRMTFALMFLAPGMLLLFAFGYFVASFRVLYRTRCYRLLFLIPAIILGYIHEAIAPAASLLLFRLFGQTGVLIFFAGGISILLAIGVIGVAIGLKRYPWNQYFDRDSSMARSIWGVRLLSTIGKPDATASLTKPNVLGYPLAQMKIVDAKTEYPIEIRWMCALLVAWTVFIIADLAFSAQELNEAGPVRTAIAIHLVCGLFALFAGGIRLAVYSTGLSSPISLPGRIMTGRLIIPGCDRVVIVPFSILAFGIIAPFAITRIPVSIALMLGVYFGGVLALAMFSPPTLKKWKLTSACRLSLPALLKQSSAQYSKTNA